MQSSPATVMSERRSSIHEMRRRNTIGSKMAVKKPTRADNANGDIACLDGAVEQHPVESQQCATTRNLEEFLPTYSRQACEDDKNGRSEQHAIPHDVDLVERYQLAKQAREACQNNT